MRLVKMMPRSITMFWGADRVLVEGAKTPAAELRSSKVSTKARAPSPEMNKIPEMTAAKRW
jgi:hypothetical protein